MQQLKIWIVIKQSINLELNEPVLEVGMNVKDSHTSQQQPQAPNAHKKKPTIRLTARVTMLWAPKGPFFTGSWSWMKSSARHTLSNRGLSEIHLRLLI